MKKTRKTIARKYDAPNLFALGCAILLTAFSLHSGGEILGLLTLLTTLALSYIIVRHTFNEIHFEKIFFYAVGLYFTLTSAIGFMLIFTGLNLSVTNFFIISLALLIAALYLTKNRQPCRVKIDWKRVLLIGGSFMAAFMLYLWPSLPSFTSPCTFGFDCTLHMEYMGTIYTLEAAVPPVQDWRYYPNGLHINGALLAHAIEPDMPSYGNLAYPMNAFIAALIVGMLAGMLYDRAKSMFYAMLFLLAILTTVYPASALIGFGFWAGSFGAYYVILFAWMLSEFVNNPDRRTLGILMLTAVGSILAYQILSSLTLVFSFILTALTLIKAPQIDRIKTTAAFIAVLGLFYCVYTLEGYSRYLSYSDEPVNTYKYFADRIPEGIAVNKGGLDTRLNGTMLQIRSHGLHVEEVFVPQGVDILQLLSKGLSIERFRSYTNIGRGNISGPSGNALYFEIGLFGLLTVFLMSVGILYSYSKRDYTLVFIEASVIHIFAFSVGLKTGQVNLYYYSKMMYYFIYPVTMYAVVGIEEIISRIGTIKKKALVFALILVLMTAYGLDFFDKEKVGMLIGERKDLYEEGRFWPLLEFNRFLRYWDMSYSIKRGEYGLAGWLQMSNKTLPLASANPKSLSPGTTSGAWSAAADFSHQTGHRGSDGSWESDAGGFGYMISGKYMDLPAGSYTITFRIKIDNNKIDDKNKVVTIEVAKDYGIPIVAKDLYAKDFSASGVYQDFTLDLDASSAIQNAEFRVHYDRSPARANIDKVALNPR
jgi:hypothetical protein